MGYILPIHHEQYTQYANRTIKKDKWPVTLTPVYKATMHTKLKNRDSERNHAQTTEPIDPVKDNHQPKKAPVNPIVIDEYLKELTGKGTIINEVV